MKINNGLSEKNVGQLIDYANNDETVRKYTSDPKRFKDRENFENWLKKDRKIYSLVDKKGNLMGISWFGAEGEGFTFALRIYGEARGRGLGYEFLKETMNKFMQLDDYKNAKNQEWWLETSKENVAAIKIYEKCGFVFETEGESLEKLIFRRRPGFES